MGLCEGHGAMCAHPALPCLSCPVACAPGMIPRWPWILPYLPSVSACSPVLTPVPAVSPTDPGAAAGGRSQLADEGGQDQRAAAAARPGRCSPVLCQLQHGRVPWQRHPHSGGHAPRQRQPRIRVGVSHGQGRAGRGSTSLLPALSQGPWYREIAGTLFDCGTTHVALFVSPGPSSLLSGGPFLPGCITEFPLGKYSSSGLSRTGSLAAVSPAAPAAR